MKDVFIFMIVIFLSFLLYAGLTEPPLFYEGDIAYIQSLRKPNTITITAETLIEDYDDNEIRGNKKYKNKLIIIEGTVTDITEGMFGTLTIDLNYSVHCTLNKSEKDRLLNISKGDRLEIKGKVNDSIFSTIGISDCKIIKNFYK